MPFNYLPPVKWTMEGKTKKEWWKEKWSEKKWAKEKWSSKAKLIILYIRLILHHLGIHKIPPFPLANNII